MSNEELLEITTKALLKNVETLENRIKQLQANRKILRRAICEIRDLETMDVKEVQKYCVQALFKTVEDGDVF